MKTLTPEQEESLLREFDDKFPFDGDKSYIYTEDEVIAFARLYHAQASKTEMSGEVKTAEEMIGQKDKENKRLPIFVHWPEPTTYSRETVLTLMREYAAQFESKWISVEDELPEKGIEVIGYRNEWKDEDYNPNGTRVCFFNDGDYWTYAVWCGQHDQWHTRSTNDEGWQSNYENPPTKPTHWQPLP